MKLLAISGSLRRESLNGYLLGAVKECLPQDVELATADIGSLPLYNEDLDGDSKPEPVVRLIGAIAAADGLVIATPEYNYGIPGGLKNAIDWASRPAYRSVLAHRPTLIMSASKSPIGGARAQAQLKNVLLATLTPVFTAPELTVPAAQKVFTEDGVLTDDSVRRKLERLVGDYCAWLAAYPGPE